MVIWSLDGNDWWENESTLTCLRSWPALTLCERTSSRILLPIMQDAHFECWFNVVPKTASIPFAYVMESWISLFDVWPRCWVMVKALVLLVITRDLAKLLLWHTSCLAVGVLLIVDHFSSLELWMPGLACPRLIILGLYVYMCGILSFQFLLSFS